jgi:hypothetical protein
MIMRFRGWQQNKERAPPTQLALCPDCTAVQLNESLADRQTQAKPIYRARQPRIYSMKPLKDLF